MRITIDRHGPPEVKVGDRQTPRAYPTIDLEFGDCRLLAHGALYLTDKPFDIDMLDLDAIACQGIEKVAQQLDGRFWVVLVDARRNQVEVASDPFASFPLLVVRREASIILTDDPLEAARASQAGIDTDSVFLLLTTGYVFAGRTLHRDVRRAPAGQLLVLRGGAPERRITLGAEEPGGTEGYKAPDQLLADIDAAILRGVAGGKRVMLALSGGIDSRLLAVRLAALGVDFEALTWTGNKSAADPLNDVGLALEVSNALGVRHHLWRWQPDEFPHVADVFIARTGGLSGNFQLWPQGEDFLRKFEGRSLLIGHEAFGWKATVGDLAGALSQLQIYPFHDERVRVFPDVLALLEETHPIPEDGQEIDTWKQRVYREIRLVEMIINADRALTGMVAVEAPLLDRRLVSRLTKTKPTLMDDKYLARKTLDMVLPDALSGLPAASTSLFEPPGRFGALWSQHRESVMDTLKSRTALSEYVDIGLYLIGLDRPDPVNILRRDSTARIETAIGRYFDRRGPSLSDTSWRPGFGSFLKLNANRPAYQAVSMLYAMQRFLMMASNMPNK